MKTIIDNKEYKVELEKSVIDSVIRDYEERIRESLLKGEEVSIPGVGSLKVSYRRVKNDAGRNFSLRVKVKQDRKFARELVTEYNKNPEKFRGSNLDVIV